MSVPYVPQDDELERQLAHLDALELRESQRRLAAADGTRASIRPLDVQPSWPRGVPPPPGPEAEATSVAPYIAWLDLACSLIGARVETSEGELERLRSQWIHVLANIQRLRIEEVEAVVESQARLREAIANDAALHEVLRSQRDQLASWSEALASPLTDPELVRRLLDDVVEERSRVRRQATGWVVDLLSTLLLDMEIVERRAGRDPGSAIQLLQGLRERLAGATARLRDQPRADDVPLMLAGETLPPALRRMADRYGGLVAVDLRCSVVEAPSSEQATAVCSVVRECLAHLADQQAGSCEVTVDAGQAGVSLRIATPSTALLPDGEPGWLLRARARAALAGGRLVCARAGDGQGNVVEVRFN